MYTVKTLPATSSLPLRHVVTNTSTGKRSTAATHDQRAAVATVADVTIDRVSQPKGLTKDKRTAYVIATPRRPKTPRRALHSPSNIDPRAAWNAARAIAEDRIPSFPR